MSRRMGGRHRSRRGSRRMMGGLFPTNQIMPYLPVQYTGHLALGGGRRSRRMMMGGNPNVLFRTSTCPSNPNAIFPSQCPGGFTF